MMHTILIANSFYAPDSFGGAEISTQLLAEGMSARFDVHVLATGGHRSGIDTSELHGVTVHRIPNSNRYWPGDGQLHGLAQRTAWHVIDASGRRNLASIRAVLDEVRPSLVHSQNLIGIGTRLWEEAARRDIPIVHTTRDYALLGPTRLAPLNRWIRSVNRRRSSRVACAVGVSGYTINQHVSAGLFASARVTSVPNIVDAPCLRTGARSSRAPLHIGSFGQLRSNKGVDVLIDAVRTLPHDIVGQVTIAGAGPERDALNKRAEGDPRFEFAGKLPIEEVYRRMAAVDLVVVPSIWAEPFGRTIIEANAQGTPVLASDVGGVPDAIGDPSMLFEAGNVAQLAERIRRQAALDDDEIAEQQQACMRSADRFRDNVPAYRPLYEQLGVGREQVAHE